MYSNSSLSFMFQLNISVTNAKSQSPGVHATVVNNFNKGVQVYGWKSSQITKYGCPGTQAKVVSNAK